MKKQMLYISILVAPFLGMILVNELVKLNTKDRTYIHQGILAINSVEELKDQCSWACHNNTEHCKTNHVKYAQPYFDKIDPIYNGIIHSLQGTGNYNLANLIFLVFLFPLAIFFLLIKSISIQMEIRNLKNNKSR